MNPKTPTLLSALSAAAFAATFLAGCATSADCSSDWYSIGARDGRLGALPQGDYYASRCTGPVDRARYRSGWEAGYVQRPLPGW